MRRAALDPSPERCGIFLISVLQSAIKAVTRLLRVACPSGQELLENKMLEAPCPQSPDPRTLVDPPTAATQRPLSSSQPPQGIWHQYGSRPRLPLAFVLSNRPDLDQQNLAQPGDESETPVGSQKPQMPFRDPIIHFNSITCTSLTP